MARSNVVYLPKTEPTNQLKQVGFKNAIYHWPAFAGDTITKRFIIKSIRASQNNEYRCVK